MFDITYDGVSTNEQRHMIEQQNNPVLLLLLCNVPETNFDLSRQLLRQNLQMR